MPSNSSVRVPGEHFAIATTFLLAGAVGLVWAAPDIATGNFLAPRVGAVTHLFTLGWLTITIFGALTQLIPTSFGVTLYSPRLARLGAWTLGVGVALFATGVATHVLGALAGGLLVIIAGILCAAWNVAATLRRASTRDVTWAAIAIGTFYLVSALGFGMVLTHNLHTGFVAAHRVHFLAAHLHIALIGWVLIVIVGVSTRLLPMFLMAPRVKHTANRIALRLLAVAVPLLAVGLALGVAALTWAGALLACAGVVAFVVQVMAFYRGRMRRQVDAGMTFARMGVIFLAASVALGFLTLVEGVQRPRVATAYIVTVLLGGLVLFVTGFAYKIIPLLAWTARFGGRPAGSAAVTAADLYSASLARVQLYFTTVAVLLLLAGIAIASPVVARTGAVVFLCGMLLFARQAIRICCGTPAVLQPPAPAP